MKKNKNDLPEAHFALPVGKRILPPKGSVMDDRLIPREFFNANDFDVTFVRNTEFDEYISASSIPLGEKVYVCRPETWTVLPHALFTARWPDGRTADEVIAHFNFGNDIGKGKRPNRDTLRKARRHVNG